jgi:iron(III) transport system substrate-binding protein
MNLLGYPNSLSGEPNNCKRRVPMTSAASNIRRATMLSAALLLAACGGTTSDTSTTSLTPEESTGQELRGQTVTIYSGRNETLMAPLFEQFTNDTGIEVEVRYGDSGEMAALILTEGDKSPADVYFSQDAGALGAVDDSGLFAALPDDITSLVAPTFQSDTGNWVATSGRARVLVYNQNLVAVPPASLDDVLDPRWKGKIGYAPSNASWQSFVTALRVTRGEAGARTWLEGFAANEPVPYEKNGVVRDAVNSGEVSLGLINHYYLYELIASVGQENVVTKNHYFKDGDAGSLINVAGAAVLASSDRIDAALAFVRYLLSPAGQKYFVERTFEYPMISGVSAFSELPTLEELNPPAINLADLKSLEATQAMLEDVGLLTR